MNCPLLGEQRSGKMKTDWSRIPDNETAGKWNQVEIFQSTRKTAERRMYFDEQIWWADNITSIHLRNDTNNIILKYVVLYKLTLHLSVNR